MSQNSLVLGASSGIGLAITKSLLEQDVNVTGISRSDFNLNNKNYEHIKLDVTDKLFIETITKKINLQNFNNLIY